MRERMLFLSDQNHCTEDLEGGMRTGNLLNILLEKYDIDLLACGNLNVDYAEDRGNALIVHKANPAVNPRRAYPGNADKGMRAKLKEMCSSNHYRHVFISHSLPGNCVDLIRQMLPDAVVITDAYPCESQLSAGKKFRKKGLRQSYHKLNSLWVRRDKQKLMNRTSLLLATSEWDALMFKSLSIEDAVKVHVIPHFVDLNRNEYQSETSVIKENWIVLRWDMNTDQGKNAILAFYQKIYPLIKARVPDIRCYIASRGLHPKVARLLKQDESIIILNPEDRVEEYIRRAKVVIAPLFEGCKARLRVLESWALKTPVVSSSKGSEGLICEHNRNIMLAGTATEFAESAVTLLENAELGAVMAESAHQTLLKHYVAARVKEKMLSLV